MIKTPSFVSIKAIILLFMTTLLVGCGFQFRDEYLIPEDIATLSLTSFDQYASLTREVSNELRMNGIEIVAPSAAIPNIHLISESVGERTLSLYQNSRAAEKELTYLANYRVVIPNEGTKTFVTQVNRSFLDNPLTALAKSVERDLIEDEMRQQAAKQIIRQLARLRASFDSNSVDAGTLDSLDTIPEAGQEVPLDQDDLYRDPVAEEILQEQQEANQTLSIE